MIPRINEKAIIFKSRLEQMPPNGGCVAMSSKTCSICVDLFYGANNFPVHLCSKFSRFRFCKI